MRSCSERSIRREQGLIMTQNDARRLILNGIMDDSTWRCQHGKFQRVVCVAPLVAAVPHP